MVYFLRISAWVLLIVGVLRGAGEILGTAYERDLDYYVYQAQLMLSGGSPLPWVREFDDKFPITYLFFLPSAILLSVRPCQLMILGGLLVSVVFLAQLCWHLLVTGWSVEKRVANAIGFFVGAVFLYIEVFLASSISHINSLTPIFFIVAAWLLTLAWKGGSSHKIVAFVLAALCMAVSISIRPYMLIPGLLMVPWLFSRGKTMGKPPVLLLLTTLWALAIGFWGFVLNALPYVIDGKTDLFWAGVTFLRQNIQPFNIPLYFQLQVQNILTLPNYSFIAFGSLLAVPLLLWAGRNVLGLADLVAHKAVRVDVLFVCILMPLTMQLTMMSKQYYPHYLQMFGGFVALSLALLFACLYQYLIANHGLKAVLGFQSGKVLGLSFLVVLLANLFLVRGEILFAITNLIYRPTDYRMAEYVTFQRDSTLQPILKAGFLYPESMSFHWKFKQHRYGFPNTAATDLIGGGLWKNLIRPEILNIPKDKEAYCAMLGAKAPPYVITRTPWIESCLDNRLTTAYQKLPDVNHELIDTIQRKNNLLPYRLSIYKLKSPVAPTSASS